MSYHNIVKSNASRGTASPVSESLRSMWVYGVAPPQILTPSLSRAEACSSADAQLHL